MNHPEYSFAEGFLRETGTISEKIAAGLLTAAAGMPLDFTQNGLFASAEMRLLPVTTKFDAGLIVDHERVPEELRRELAPWETGRLIDATRTDEERKAEREKLCWGGGWGGHANPAYDMLLSLGTAGLRERIALYEKLNPGREVFYRGLKTALDALDLLAARASREAAEKAGEAEGEEKENLLRLSRALARAPKLPAGDFHEAAAAFWLVFTFDGIDSPGRFDQFMFPAYQRSDPGDARRVMKALWEEFFRTRTWNLCLSGSDENWRDETNDLTYMILEIAAEAKYNTPNVTLRVHRNTPDKLYKAAAKTLATGIGMPALYNDETVVPALEALGIPAVDAHRYCMNGCNQIDIMGKSHMGLEDGEVSLIKCLELALCGGKSLLTGERLGPETPLSFESFDEVMDAYKKQVEHASDLAIAMANKAQEVRGLRAPNPLRSNLIMGCVEKGADYRAGGPLYNHGQILTEGLADAADALAAIRHLVFEKKEISMERLLRAIRTDFEGEEVLRQKLRSDVKFGNDDDRTDLVAGEIYEHFFRYLLTKRTWRGGIYGGGLSTFNRTAAYGSQTGASANGRKNRDPLLADSLGAEPGCDVKGPTAALLSAAKYDQTLAKSGLVMNIKFDKSLFVTERGEENFIRLWKTYFEKGGQQLSVNVVSRDELLDAKEHPELHRDLIVRVGGFSEYFWKLPEELQDNVIERSSFAV